MNRQRALSKYSDDDVWWEPWWVPLPGGCVMNRVQRIFIQDLVWLFVILIILKVSNQLVGIYHWCLQCPTSRSYCSGWRCFIVSLLRPVLLPLLLSPLLSIQVLMCWFLRPIHYCRWIFSCFGVAQHPDSPIPFVWAIRDYINQDALFCKGREPEGSGGGWALLQRRPREAVLRPSRDRPWQLWRRLLCTGAKSSLWLTLTHCTWIFDAKKMSVFG